MGVIYSALPVNDDSRSWLEEMGIDVSDLESRYPLIGEIYDTLNHLEGFSFDADEMEIGRSWDAQISDSSPSPSQWTRMTILECRPPAEPQQFHFSKGSPELIFRIMTSLADKCGALALAADGEDAFLIPPHSDSSSLYNEWLGAQETKIAEQAVADQRPARHE